MIELNKKSSAQTFNVNLVSYRECRFYSCEIKLFFLMTLDEGKKKLSKLLYISYFRGISFSFTHAHKRGQTHTHVFIS